MRAWLLLSVLPALLPTHDAAACIYPSNDAFVPGPPEEIVAPGPVTIESATIFSDGGPCDVPVLRVYVTATDDVTPSIQLGFQVRVVEGPRPAQLHTPDNDVTRRATSDLGNGALYFTTTIEPGGADFVLGVSAIDLGGNVGPESTARVTYGLEDGGCRSTADAHPFAPPIAIALGLVVRRRRSPAV